MIEMLILVFTSAISANAVYALAYGTEALDAITEDARSTVLVGAVLTLVTAVTQALVWCISVLGVIGGYTILILAPLSAFGVTAGVAYAFKKLIPKLYASVEPYISLISSNTAIVGIVYGVTSRGTGLYESVLSAVCSAFGVMAAYIVFAVIREGISESKQPHALRGAPTLLITSGLIAMVFYGLCGMRF